MEAIMVGTLGGVFKVVRSGAGWKVASQSLTGLEANAVVAHSRQCGIVFAGIRGGGLEKKFYPTKFVPWPWIRPIPRSFTSVPNPRGYGRAKTGE